MVEFIKKSKKRRKKLFLVKAQRALSLISLCSLVIIALYAFTFGNVMSKIENIFYEITASNGFAVKSVTVTGYSEISEDLIDSIVQIRDNQSIFEISTATLVEKFRKVSAIDKIELKRVLPDHIVIKIHERQPVAMSFSNENGYKYLDKNGVTFDYGHKINYDQNYMRFVHQNIDSQEIKKIIDIFTHEDGLSSKVENVINIAERRWNLHLFSGTVIKLPEQGYASAFKNLSQNHNFLDILNMKPEYIDLRLKGKVIVKPSTEQEQEI